jgi:hypothetical protein
MYKCLVIIAVYSSFFFLGLIHGRGQNNPSANNQEDSHVIDLCCISTWSAKPVWTLTYDPVRDIVFFGSCGCVCMLDVSDPSHPKKIAEFEHSQCNTCGLFYQQETNRLFICDGLSGLKIWDIRNPEKPVELGAYDTPGYACAVHVVDTKAYIADGDGGLRIIDVSYPSRPEEIGHIDMTTACCVDIKDTYAYVGDLGLKIINISNPYKPKVVAFHSTPGVAYGVQVSGNKVYVADDWCGIRVIDISDIKNPHEVGYLETPGFAWDIKISGSLAFVSAYNGGLRIVDISNPTVPKEIAFHETPDKALQAIILGSHIYVAAAGKGLLVYGFSG